MADNTPTRHLSLEGAYNVRDIGGYSATDGRMTRWGRIWRADSLHRLTPGSQDTLRLTGVKTIIDLRDPTEVTKSPDVLMDGIDYANIPLLPGSVKSSPPSTLLDLYMQIIDDCSGAISNTLLKILEVSPSPIIIHCSAGKDRTGIIIALLLSVCDVLDDTIAMEYAFTTERIKDSLLPDIRARATQMGISSSVFEPFLESKAETMMATLAYIKTKYSSTHNYLLNNIGLTTDQISRLRQLILDQ